MNVVELKRLSELNEKANNLVAELKEHNRIIEQAINEKRVQGLDEFVERFMEYIPFLDKLYGFVLETDIVTPYTGCGIYDSTYFTVMCRTVCGKRENIIKTSNNIRIAKIENGKLVSIIGSLDSHNKVNYYEYIPKLDEAYERLIASQDKFFAELEKGICEALEKQIEDKLHNVTEEQAHLVYRMERMG